MARCLFMTFFVISICIHLINSQADIADNNTITIDRLPIRDKALYVAAYVADHPKPFSHLEKIFYVSKAHREQSSSNTGAGKLLQNALLDFIPMIIQNPDFLVDLAILEDELMKVDLKDVQTYQKMNRLSGEGRKCFI